MFLDLWFLTFLFMQGGVWGQLERNPWLHRGWCRLHWLYRWYQVNMILVGSLEMSIILVANVSFLFLHRIIVITIELILCVINVPGQASLMPRQELPWTTILLSLSLGMTTSWVTGNLQSDLSYGLLLVDILILVDWNSRSAIQLDTLLFIPSSNTCFV